MSLKFPSEFRLNHPNERHSTTKAIDATRIERRRPWNVVGASTRHVGFHSITIQRKLNLPVIDFVKEALDVDRDDETLAAVWSRMTENRSSLDSCSRRLVGFATGTQIPQQLALQSFEIPERGLNPTPPTRWLWLESGSIGLGRDSRANPYLFCRNPKRTGQSRQARLATPVCGSAETYWEFVATTANSTGDMNGLEDYLELGDYFGQQETHLHKPPHAPLGSRVVSRNRVVLLRTHAYRSVMDSMPRPSLLAVPSHLSFFRCGELKASRLAELAVTARTPETRPRRVAARTHDNPRRERSFRWAGACPSSASQCTGRISALDPCASGDMTLRRVTHHLA